VHGHCSHRTFPNKYEITRDERIDPESVEPDIRAAASTCSPLKIGRRFLCLRFTTDQGGERSILIVLIIIFHITHSTCLLTQEALVRFRLAQILEIERRGKVAPPKVERI